ncbi:LOW QUALITY PROTEIN: hyaluronan mediated motility receptor-like [Denticeps clupeoides]|uniref:LOW QUALITY PROTEIN: hyaluronan mediated motility receptor-like n=1 Tax=Denticeps clupeoides TaxID=299321 RepID=UPI0010A5971F|nr:LOW QUALITY PROTEIN: hyaluronan mediated motility receptor-like [Denticeps clupeoides]
MSFSRAPLKRFNEHTGCAPAPGTYELKPGEAKGPVSFHKAERFKAQKATGSSLPANITPEFPVRRSVSDDGLTEGSSAKKEKSSISVYEKQQRLLEKEIRSLVQQRGEQDRRLMTLEEDLKKLEAKLLVTVREKTGLAASVASLERQLAEVKKVNEFLKSKVSIDCAKKRINSLTAELMEARNKVDVKDKELSFLQISSEGQLKVLQTDLDACRATLYALKERNQDLEDLHKETKVQNEELENEINKLHAIIEELRSDLKVVQGYLDIANERDSAELQESQECCGRGVQSYRIVSWTCWPQRTHFQSCRGEQSSLSRELQESQGLLRERDAELENCKEELIASERGVEEAERKVEQCGQQLQLSQHQLTEKDAELQMEKTMMKRVEQEVQQSQDLLRRQDAELQNCKQKLIASEQSLMETESKLKQCEDDLQASHDATQKAVQQKEEELARLKEVLRQTEDELDQRVTNLAERCQTLEKERARAEEVCLIKVEELKKQVSSLEESRRMEQEELEELKQSSSTLASQLKEQECAQSMADMLTHVAEDCVVRTVPASRKQERQREEAIEQLQNINLQLQTEVLNLQAQLEGSSEKHKELKLVEAHDAAMKSLQEKAQQRIVQDWRVGQLSWRGAAGWLCIRAASSTRGQGGHQGELSRLSDAYARLLGHQNHKQKIKHVMKMKQENFELKQEVTKLRTQVGKQKREMQQFCAGQAPPRFDPSKAFMHEHKENQQPLSTVRQGN